MKIFNLRDYPVTGPPQKLSDCQVQSHTQSDTNTAHGTVLKRADLDLQLISLYAGGDELMEPPGDQLTDVTFRPTKGPSHLFFWCPSLPLLLLDKNVHYN